MNLTTKAVLRLMDALQHFDAPAPESEGKPTREPYKLAGSVRMAMAKNIARLGEVVNAYQKARNSLVYQYANGGNTVPEDRIAEFEKDHAALLESTNQVALIRLTTDMLQLDANAVPVTVLAALMPILKPDNDEAEAA